MLVEATVEYKPDGGNIPVAGLAPWRVFHSDNLTLVVGPDSNHTCRKIHGAWTSPLSSVPNLMLILGPNSVGTSLVPGLDLWPVSTRWPPSPTTGQISDISHWKCLE